MSLKDGFNKLVDDTKDAINEARHKTSADLERENRLENDDIMTPGEKAGSVVRETGHEIAAGVDHAKRDVRDAT